MINKNNIKTYLENKFGGEVAGISIGPFGKGCLGAGYLLEFEIGGKKYSKVLKSLYTEHLGKEYPSDRAQSLILAHSTYGLMENHVRSMDVVAIEKNGRINSVGEAEEFFIIMDKAGGVDYFNDIKKIAQDDKLEEADKNKAIILAKFLANLHKEKFKKETLYKRKIRDTIGGGESIMGVMDMYPEKLAWFPEKTQVKIIQKAIEYWMRDKYKVNRLCRIHGDFHPGNIWFKSPADFILLDRARGEFGEAADDITAFLINYIFYSLIYRGNFSGALRELTGIFVKEYVGLSRDKELEKVSPPFWAFRVAVLCNPVFYPDDFFPDLKKAKYVRKKMVNFAVSVLNDKKFSLKRINEYFQ